jgi:DNA-binding transcriptional ArsR family regulator
MRLPFPCSFRSEPTGTEHLYRVRSAVRAILVLGVAASVTANVLHAEPSPVGRSIAAWPPVALLLTIELISRVPVHRWSLALLRMATTGAVAGIAAWVSYWHMVDVAMTHGEHPVSAHLVPVSVDGLVVVASVCLVEIDARLREESGHGSAAHRKPLGGRADEAPCDRPDRATGGGAEGSPVALRAVGTAAVRGGDTRAAVARLRQRHPDMSAVEIARRLGVSDRTVRRHLHGDPRPEADTGPDTRPDNTADGAPDRKQGPTSADNNSRTVEAA